MLPSDSLSLKNFCAYPRVPLRNTKVRSCRNVCLLFRRVVVCLDRLLPARRRRRMFALENLEIRSVEEREREREKFLAAILVDRAGQ